MRTARLLATAAAVVTAVALTPVAPAHAAGAVAYRYSSSGLSAGAFFTDVPDSGPVARVTYHDTFVNAGESATRIDGTRSNGPFAYFDQVTYSFDRRGNFVFGSETIGFADGAAVTYAADKKLTSASVDASVPVQTCDASWTCADAGTVSVAASWTGYGAISRSSGSGRYSGDGFHYSFHFNGTSRQATATGYGNAQWAELDNGTYSERCIGSGC